MKQSTTTCAILAQMVVDQEANRIGSLQLIRINPLMALDLL